MEVPPQQAGFWRQWRAFTGPAILVSVGYMDPGNWGTDLAGGAQFKYGLLWVVALASFMAVILQVISARLGVATGKDLAQCCRDYYPQWTRWPNWISMEIAVAATDLAESLGSAVALNLLVPHPHVVGDHHHRLRRAAPAVACRASACEASRRSSGSSWRPSASATPSRFSCFRTCDRTSWRWVGALVHPNFREAGMIVVAIGMIGATVMPHNLYLHSALVQTRKLKRDDVPSAPRSGSTPLIPPSR